jgi:hypothetical protein
VLGVGWQEGITTLTRGLVHPRKSAGLPNRSAGRLQLPGNEETHLAAPGQRPNFSFVEDSLLIVAREESSVALGVRCSRRCCVGTRAGGEAVQWNCSSSVDPLSASVPLSGFSAVATWSK